MCNWSSAVTADYLRWPKINSLKSLTVLSSGLISAHSAHINQALYRLQIWKLKLFSMQFTWTADSRTEQWNLPFPMLLISFRSNPSIMYKVYQLNYPLNHKEISQLEQKYFYRTKIFILQTGRITIFCV